MNKTQPTFERTKKASKRSPRKKLSSHSPVKSSFDRKHSLAKWTDHSTSKPDDDTHSMKDNAIKELEENKIEEDQQKSESVEVKSRYSSRLYDKPQSIMTISDKSTFGVNFAEKTGKVSITHAELRQMTESTKRLNDQYHVKIDDQGKFYNYDLLEGQRYDDEKERVERITMKH